MNNEEKKQFAEKARETIIATEKNIAALENLTKPISPDNAIGRLSRMEALSSKGVNEAALATARQKLGRLKYAIANLDSDDFGICMECGEPIPMARILAVPESALCVNCAE